MRIKVEFFIRHIINKMENNALNDLVEVCPERFAKLEELERNLPDIINKAIADYKKESLRKLHERDKNNPENVRNRVKKYIAKNKDIINEKRREKRKEKIIEAQQHTSTIVSQATKSTPISEGEAYESYVPNVGITVRFNT